MASASRTLAAILSRRSCGFVSQCILQRTTRARKVGFHTGVEQSFFDGKPQRDCLSAAHQEALHQFEAQIVGRPDGDIDVTQAAALLALHADPGIDVEESILAPLRRLASDFSVRAAEAVPSEAPLPEPMRPHALAGVLCDFMCSAGFAGCAPEDYYQADNSLMDQVLARRRGIPISLSLVYQEVGRGGGLILRGMNFPGHFLLAYGSSESAGLLDAFSNRTVTSTEVSALIGGIMGREVRMDNSWQTAPHIPNSMLLRRMVLNLQNVYRRDGNSSSAAVLEHYAQVLEKFAQSPVE